MSKSTPITQLSMNKDENDTRPIVVDILKEIELEQDGTQKLETNDTDYLNEQNKALNYQLDDKLVQDDDEDQVDDMEQAPLENFENYEMDDDLTQNVPIVEHPQYNNEDNTSQLINKLFVRFKDPILCFLIVMVFSVPQISEPIQHLFNTLPFLSSSTGSILTKSLMIATLFYFLKQNI